MKLLFILPIAIVTAAFLGCDSQSVSPADRKAMDVRPDSATASPTFIEVTQEYRWPNGVVSQVGEVERVMAVEDNHYLIWFPSESRFLLPQECAKVISAEDAAIRLVVHRQELYTQLRSATARIRAKSNVITIDRNSEMGNRGRSEGLVERPTAPRTPSMHDRPYQPPAMTMPPPIDWNARQRAASQARADEAVRNSRMLESQRQARDAEAVARGAERGMERALGFGF